MVVLVLTAYVFVIDSIVLSWNMNVNVNVEHIAPCTVIGSSHPQFDHRSRRIRAAYDVYVVEARSGLGG
jgi:hypothetical protein